ncbi:MAG: response regulator [Desulfobacteraceae bacterium]|jgi:PAS domain S-box-containing protein
MDALIHILHLEDNPMDMELVQAKLEEQDLAYRITRVQTEAKFDAVLHEGGLDIILADYQLPMYDGLSALRLAKQRRPEVPFIFVSGAMGEETAIEALTRGATDYVLKQNLSRLGPAVRRALQESRDRRDRKRAEEALAQSEVKMRCILDSVDEGFSVIDRDYHILSANKAFCNFVGKREDQIIGRLCHEMVHHSTQPCFGSSQECPVKRTFETGTGHTAFHTHKDGFGTRYHVELKTYPMVDTSGTITSVIETIIDVTEKRKLQEQLVQSQKMESIARLAGGVAHDFNNMLSVIIGHTELAMGQMNPSQPIYENLREIRRAGERSAALVRQLLAFARKQTVAPKVLDLNETVAGMLNMMRPLIGEDIDLIWRPAEAVWPVKIDPSQIDQILANLCVNARDAIDGVGRIIIETGMVTIDPDLCARHSEFVPGEYVSLTVSDDGCGMDQQTMSSIFEPFFTTKEVGRGTGLGLATVYGIVKQNNGLIDVNSNPGHGTTFELYLPRHAAATVEARRHVRTVPPPGGHETVLLVEDEASILAMAELMLGKLGYRVLSAATPSKAIRLAREHHKEISLLIVDVIMPEMNGRDLAKQLVALSPEMACLFMSGHSGDIIAQHGMLYEEVHFIQKPFSIQDLAAKVRQVLEDV